MIQLDSLDNKFQASVSFLSALEVAEELPQWAFTWTFRIQIQLIVFVQQALYWESFPYFKFIYLNSSVNIRKIRILFLKKVAIWN